MGEGTALGPFKTEQRRAVHVGPGWKTWEKSSYSIPPSLLSHWAVLFEKFARVSAQNLLPLMLLETERTSGSILPWDMGEEATTKPPGRYFTKIAGTDFLYIFIVDRERKQPPFLVPCNFPLCRGSSVWLQGAAEKHPLSQAPLERAS